MILVISIALPIILIYLLNKHRKAGATSVAPPGPRGLPVIGNLYHLATATNLPVYLWQLSKKHGPIIHMKIGSVPILVVSSAKLAQEVLKTQDLAFCSRPKFIGQQKLSYNGADIAFSPPSGHWRERKRMSTVNLFSPTKVQSFRPVREDEISRMVAKISRYASSHQAVNLSEIAMGFTSTLLCRIAFGKRYEEQGSELQRFNELLKEARVVMASIFVSDYFPSFSWLDKLTGLTSRLDRIFDQMDSFYQELIDEHLDPSWAKKKEGTDILDLLIKLEEHKSSKPNWDHIKAMLMNIFIGGTDSSAAAIVWCMTALTKAPNMMKKVQGEIRDFVGEKGRVDEDDLRNLPYLKAIINETFRLYPPIPMLLPRETTQRCILNGYEVEPKTIVHVNAWAIARDLKYWKNPDEFIPERFLNSNIDIKGQDFGVVPMGSGRRICPGMFMGLANVHLALANMLYSFDWELPLGIQVKDIDCNISPGLIMHKRNGLVLLPKKCHV